MDHLFWRVLPTLDIHQCLRYIWKVRNIMVFININVDSRDIFKLAETKAATRFEVQASLSQQITQHEETVFTALSSVQGRWCFTDGSWKAHDIFSWQRWYSTLEGFDGLMGTRNTRASLSPLHAELEAFIWTFVKYEQSMIISLQWTVPNWWRWFLSLQNGQHTQVIEKISGSWERALITPRLFMYQERRTQGLTAWHAVLGIKCHSSFTWMQSCRVSSKNLSWVYMLMTKKHL